MGNLNSESKYESLRLARISENMARLASLGLDKSITELRTLASPSKTSPSERKCCRKVYDYSSLRRSNRLISQSESVPRRSTRLNGNQISSLQGKGGISKQKEWKLFEAEERELEDRNKISSDALPRRCDSRSRGSLYNPVFGICCHFCRIQLLIVFSCSVCSYKIQFTIFRLQHYMPYLDNLHMLLLDSLRHKES
ncbi:hypothetical protein MKW92_046620 [Papaver armeniacum]|nr:hypothetical protein MKW92_046620 [Papaver armeniacum]